MPEEHRNIYKTARRDSGYTQEAAAEMIAVSVESLRAYENGYRIPPNDIVERLSQFQQAHSVERLMSMAEDGRIDDQERPEFEAIMDDLREIIRSGLELDVYA